MNKILGILLLLVFVCVGTTLLTDAFVKPYNMQNIVRHSALYGIIGVGVAMVIITGGIDLSIGSVIGLVGCVLPMLLVDHGWSVPASLLSAMLLSLLIGLTHGLLITKMRLQPFIVTLCGLLVYRGLARWITSDQTKGFGGEFNDSLRLLAIGKPCSVAFLAMLAGVGATLWSAWALMQGRRAEARRDDTEGRRGAVTLVGLILDILLILIGSSRFWYGYRIDVGGAMMSLGPLSLPSWTVTVAEQGESMPQYLMTHCGWGVIPGVLWLAYVLVRRSAQPIAFPLVALGVAAVFGCTGTEARRPV